MRDLKNITISVIIPTRGRDECLRQTLRDLDQQNYSAMDIWVVDQNDKILAQLEKEIQNFKLHHHSMPPRGSHAGRNYAITRTSAEYCVFVDDDVRLDKNFVQLHIDALTEAGRGMTVVAGKVIQPKDKFSDEDMKKNGRLAKYNSLTGSVSGNFIGDQSGDVQHVHECNFSAPTKALIDVGGFNECFKGNAYFEGTDLSLRLIKKGFKIKYHPHISVVHLQESVGGNRVDEKAKHTYWMMRNQSLLNSLHMIPLGLPIFEAKSLIYVLAKAAKNKDLEIAKQGLRGIKDGLKYFLNLEKKQ